LLIRFGQEIQPKAGKHIGWSHYQRISQNQPKSLPALRSERTTPSCQQSINAMRGKVQDMNRLASNKQHHKLKI